MAISSRGEMGVGGGSRGGSGGGSGLTGTRSTNGVIKIKSGGDIKPAGSRKKMAPSYNQNKDMPNLIKIDSAKGSTVKKIAYRKRSSN